MLFLFAAVSRFLASAQAKRKVIIDQDARGPGSTDQQAILVLIQSPQTDVLGITIVSGDQWRDEEVAHTLRTLEIIGRTDIPVVPGAIFPLVNSREDVCAMGSNVRQGGLQGRVESRLSARPVRDSANARRKPNDKALDRKRRATF